MKIEDQLGIAFRNRRLLDLALVHGSRVNEVATPYVASNERLEFLGDAVLGLAIAEELYHRLPEAGEGLLTAIRSSLVRRETLAEVARNLRLGTYLQMGRGEASSGGRNKDRNLADAFEAVVAAVYLDQGYAAARTFVLSAFESRIEEACTHGTVPNYKAMLQEHLQAHCEPLPRYRVVSAVGPDHEKEFTAEALLHDTILGRGTGRSRKAAETAAACAALAHLKAKEGVNHGQT